MKKTRLLVVLGLLGLGAYLAPESETSKANSEKYAQEKAAQLDASGKAYSIMCVKDNGHTVARYQQELTFYNIGSAQWVKLKETRPQAFIDSMQSQGYKCDLSTTEKYDEDKIAGLKVKLIVSGPMTMDQAISYIQG